MFRAVLIALHPFGRAGPAGPYWQSPFGNGRSSLWIFPIVAAVLIGGHFLGLIFPDVPLVNSGGAFLALLALQTLLHQFWLIRRLHDLGRTGLWLVLITPVPFLAIAGLAAWLMPELRAWAFAEGRALYMIGTIAAIIFLLEFTRWHAVAADGDPAPNRYGPPPK
ncbi:DUF805 domain-containing protein [Hyphobacterium marinum]|uniref:DUF805 domain-containing protein n=1 Tax=Hyphobacterium marinum TaxID=3116574 RepID=A0ABU7LZP3_9PROT|nr:DUF805 domain-containing protein [Hyphobacterium sp. Y6023]MEE2566911.1 DUF805 domain-containing protein [Hyphobacterium sp. Y6023]